MIRNYLAIAIRNLGKYKVFSFINIAGMAISLASCLLITLFVWDEVKFDTHHPDADRTFRIYNIANQDGVETFLPIVPYPFASYMQKDFPEIESSLRVMDTYGKNLLETDKAKFLESQGLFAESTVFDMLSINVISGDRTTALTRPNTIALSSAIAKKYFGDKNAVGETIKIGDSAYEVTAVFADTPRHFHLSISYMMSFSSLDWTATLADNWQRQQFFTYLKLKPGTDAIALEAKLKPFVEKYAYPTIQAKGFTYIPHLQNIRDIHLHSSNFEWEIARRGNAQSVYILSGTAIMILIIACLNFINLSTARSVKRMKEVGVRKIVGAYRHQLVVQFTTESVLFTLLGLVLALVLCEIALPYVNQIVDNPLALVYEPMTITAALLFCVILGIVAGCYPAFYLSRFRPVLVLSRTNSNTGGSFFFRQSLVVLQFMLSFFLITGSWIVLSQNELLHNRNLGFDKEQVVIIPLTQDQLKNQEVTKQKYSDHPNVISATIGFGLPGDIIAGDEIITPDDGKTHSANLLCVDFDYITTMGIKIIAGRDFSTNLKTDSSEAFILNETAAKTYGYGTPEEAIGKRIHWNSWRDGGLKKGTIVGVVADFNFRSLREKMTPIVMQIFPQAAWKMAVRIRPENKKETIAHLGKVYSSLESKWVFNYSFLDENFEAMYKTEERLGKLFSIFTYLTIVVACLGLFGLVEYSVNQRIREISIRKVFGASVSSLVVLLTRRYFWLLCIAVMIIIPVCYYTAQLWLSNFAYRIDIEPMLFVKAGLTILTITIATVSFQSIRAALSNPARVLANN